jgi:hypothetical protein
MDSPSKSVATSDSRTDNVPETVVGIHLSGPNAKKSAVVVVEIHQSEAKFKSLYEKIGSVGSLFSDERIIDIMKQQNGLRAGFVDCPVSEPPCVLCERTVCPGVVRCDDVAVGMMLAIEQKRGRKGGHKLRPLNPQNLRLWDAMFGRGSEFGNLEPTYSANQAPLVVRARTLQRRLRAVLPDLTLRETNVPFLLRQMERLLGHADWAQFYRNFESGFAIREAVLSELSSQKSDALSQGIRIKIDDSDIDSIAGSVEAFHAFFAAAMGVWSIRGLARSKSQYFEANAGWVETLCPERTKTRQ